ncbi:MAG: aminotransferase class I/II-fold pyridoxal phosphate-dependent enzyme [Planctomycetes bacterium]|nr:aminotransferase class I/II-fold pyridoxal phosphate-dependent enzyme [Planctomycetota bacterium]
MAQAFIDLRSDTATKPTAGMRAAMAAAEVGDDVHNEDPTINRLQERVASYLGMEASLFVPSGTMSNQIGIRAHTNPGDEILCETTNHIYVWEAGGPAVLSGVTCRTIEGDYGILDVTQLEDKIRPINDHYVTTRLVCLENTHNRGGGRVYPFEKVQAISEWAHSKGLKMHLDGARLWNAIVASGIPGTEWGKLFDSISVCFSKGLGAPVGSALSGTKEFINKAKRIRKLFGGGTRQGGIIAAGALYGMENHIERLADDHRNAQIIAEAIADTPGLRLDPAQVETNLIWFEADRDLGTAKDIAGRLKEKGVLVSQSGPQIMRACTHLDVSTAQCMQAADVIRKHAGALVAASGRK